MPLGYIYEIFDKRKPDESAYVGSTKNHHMYRWAQHVCSVFAAQTNTPRFLKIHKFMREEGPDNFDYRVREEVFWEDSCDLRKREQLWLDQLKPKMNLKKAFTSVEDKRIANTNRQRRRSKKIVCDCGMDIDICKRPRHQRTIIHAKRMQEIALAKLKDGALVRSRPMVLSARPELPCPASPERAARVEAQAEAVDGAREVPRARANHPPADSETG